MNITGAQTNIPRLWVSPISEAVELEDHDGHGMTVAKDPERFGLPPLHFDAHLAAVNNGDTEFDFDVAIALAEARGWARVSHDAKSGIAIGAATLRAAQRAVRVLVGRGVEMSRVDVEIERLSDDRIVAVLYQLQDDALVNFQRFGWVGKGRSHELPLLAPELAVIEAQPTMAM